MTPASADYTSTDAPATSRVVLGIETSCDETAAAVVRREPCGALSVLSSVVLSQFDAHAAFGGVVPEIAARAHVEAIAPVARRALAEAGMRPSQLDAIAATAGPGLIGGVMVGLSFAKAMAVGLKVPLIAVNHLEGHAVSARLGAACDYPFLLLLVSGGHCQILKVEGIGAMTRLGTTLDDAAGEAFDKIAKVMGLGYPGGPALEALAASGNAERFELPRALLGRAGCDFSFSGLKTAAARMVPLLQGDQDRADLAASVQSAIARQLHDRVERAMRDWPETLARRFVVAGGVAANACVRARLTALCEAQGFSFHAPPLAYCTDNAAMIAASGLERLALGLTSPLDAPARPRWPLDEVTAALSPVHRTGRKGARA